jgi:nucleoside-diphosphate-sugar epimerase
MPQPSVVLITGAAGTLGRKLREHLSGRYELRLVDRDPRGDPTISQADLGTWGDWANLFARVDAVFHFAADPEAYKSWPELIDPNLDATIHVYHAAALHRVNRLIFASSNHVMGGYQNDSGVSLDADTPPRPGLTYVVDGVTRNSTCYASAKLFGERLGKCYAESHGMETIAVRLGWVLRGRPNDPRALPTDRGEWFRLMWLSDRDFLQLMDCCLLADLPARFLVINGMSNNTGMPWNLESARALGYHPQDDITQYLGPWQPSDPQARKT